MCVLVKRAEFVRFVAVNLSHYSTLAIIECGPKGHIRVKNERQRGHNYIICIMIPSACAKRMLAHHECLPAPGSNQKRLQHSSP